ncbi:SGNH/GDSL hydrolase family protein [Burkholderia alba]|uniref:hypothetical protein n=1 Tax=Burkholderia alba TaxID=2683677 RepID=UPI002B054EC6|nr:hypothetical protein [Burkholderia alba]
MYDLLVDGRLVHRTSATHADVVTTDMGTGAMSKQPGPVSTLRFDNLPGHDKQVEIWLPYNESTELIGLRTNARIEPVTDSGRRVGLHHGSAISHGSNGDSPTSIWPALAASLGDVDLINLGFGGSAPLDPFTARTMRDTPADLISIKIGINLVNTDLMRLRAFTPAVHGFLDTLREGLRACRCGSSRRSTVRFTKTRPAPAPSTSARGPKGGCRFGRRAIRPSARQES